MTAVRSTKLWNDQSSWKSIMVEHLHCTFTITCTRMGELWSPPGEPTSGIIEFMSLCWEVIETGTSAHLSHNYFRSQIQKTNQVDFTQELALQLIHSRSWRQAALAPAPSTSQMKASPQQESLVRWWFSPFRWWRRNCKGASTRFSFQPDGNGELAESMRTIQANVLQGQLYCKFCGSEFVLCGPTSGRLCYQHHVQDWHTYLQAIYYWTLTTFWKIVDM